MRWKRQELRRNKNWILHKDNLIAHPSHISQKYFVFSTNLLSRSESILKPFYSLDFTAVESLWLPQLEYNLKSQRLEAAEDIRENSLRHLNAIP
ncbi:hypothetical protein AVEN_238196-1 [Araneus ventricosus]|uniref:Uncharacterized protein n=1 Tax=Araneus ventricosus TaxID=182803 RepID=A0A4Y2UPX1_ARAVE|nr:hypothetical protein AVEN_151295-1 [Araneus ventricosus]GBO14753.1 hypothetical protein AVEN_238196-1 [Araneus ventricosus]